MFLAYNHKLFTFVDNLCEDQFVNNEVTLLVQLYFKDATRWCFLLKAIAGASEFGHIKLRKADLFLPFPHLLISRHFDLAQVLKLLTENMIAK